MSDLEVTDRQRTMAVRALRRLSACEVSGLGIALEQLDAVEAALVGALPALRRGAEQERDVRRAKRQPQLEGPYVGALLAVRDVLRVLEVARDETTSATSSGRVPKC